MSVKGHESDLVRLVVFAGTITVALRYPEIDNPMEAEGRQQRTNTAAESSGIF